MKILVSGFNGFIGSRLFDRLDKKHELAGIDIRSGQDIRNRYVVEQVFEWFKPEVVIHLAALTGVRRSEDYPQEYIDTNIMGTKNMIDMADKYNVLHFVNFSSSSVYGSESEEALMEEDELNAKSVYGMTKLAAENLVNRANSPTTIIRPFTVYGNPGRYDQVLENWINAINKGVPIVVYRLIKDHRGQGYPKRGFTYIEDLLDGVEKVLERDSDHNRHETYNLGGNELIDVGELAQMFRDHCRKVGKTYQAYQPEIPKADAKANLADITKAQEELGYFPNTDFFAKIREILHERIK